MFKFFRKKDSLSIDKINLDKVAIKLESTLNRLETLEKKFIELSKTFKKLSNKDNLKRCKYCNSLLGNHVHRGRLYCDDHCRDDYYLEKKNAKKS